MTKRDALAEESRETARRAHTLGQESLLIYEAAQQAIAETKELLDSVAHQLIKPGEHWE